MTLDRANGKKLGVNLLKGAGGKGASVKSVDEGSQAEGFPQIVAGRVITHVNGREISDLAMKGIGGIILAQDSTEFTFDGEFFFCFLGRAAPFVLYGVNYIMRVKS